MKARASFLVAALEPLLYFQGKAVRRSLPELPEPAGERRGEAGYGVRLRLLIVGDSAAAGVGVAHQNEALAGRLAAVLGRRFAVAWQVQAKTGATTASTLRHLERIEAAPFDVALVSLGVNDVTSGVSLGTWRVRQRALRQCLRERFGVAQIIACGLPPVHRFPSLPQPLRWYLGARASSFDEALAQDVRSEADVHFLSLRFSEDAGLVAADGFHPGPAAYRQWADLAASLIEAFPRRE
jgi:lysophospholipase L1-like esterase